MARLPLVSLSYAEGTAAIRETGGAATFVRRAFNDLAGFITGWALFLDYLIVIALAALVLPHYFGLAIGWDAIDTSPGTRSSQSQSSSESSSRAYVAARGSTAGIGVAAFDLVTQLLLVVLGFAFLFSPHALTQGVSLGALAVLARDRVRAAARDARLHGSRDRREPRRGDATPGRAAAAEPVRRRSALVVVVYVAIALVGPAGVPGARRLDTALGDDVARRAADGHRRRARRTPSRAGFVHAFASSSGITGAFILLAAATTSISGFGRLAYSLGEHGQLPRVFGRLHRRTLVAPQSLLAAGRDLRPRSSCSAAARPAVTTFLASLFSFGVLLAFTAAQLAVIRLRYTEPELPAPVQGAVQRALRGARFRSRRSSARSRTFAIWIVAMARIPLRATRARLARDRPRLYFVVRHERGGGPVRARRLHRRAGRAGDGVPRGSSCR